MRTYLLNILIISLLFVSCAKTTEKKYVVKQLDAYSFRSNFYGNDNFTNKNPVQNLQYKTRKGKFYDELTQHGIINNGELVLNKLDSLPNYFTYKVSNRDLKLLISFPETFEISGRILSFREKGTIFHVDTLLFNNPTKVTFSTMDLNNNGTDELYILHENYAVKGHNYELSVYELIEK